MTNENEIDWINEDSRYIDRKIRALSPKYGAYTFLKKSHIQLYYTLDKKRKYMHNLKKKKIDKIHRYKN